MFKKFEYKIDWLKYDMDGDNDTPVYLNQLNELGAEGWELVSVWTGMMILKREIIQDEA